MLLKAKGASVARKVTHHRQCRGKEAPKYRIKDAQVILRILFSGRVAPGRQSENSLVCHTSQTDTARPWCRAGMAESARKRRKQRCSPRLSARAPAGMPSSSFPGSSRVDWRL